MAEVDATRRAGRFGCDGRRFVRRPGARRRRAAEDHAGPDRGCQEGGQAFLVHLGRPAGGREDRQGLRGGLSRRQHEGRALGRRAHLPAHRPGVSEQDLQLRRGEQLRRRAPDHLEARLDAGLLPAGGGRQVFSQGALGSRRHVCLVARHALADRLQHQPGESRGRAEGLHGSSGAQVVGQDRQGASGLQRHHHDGDPAAQPRSRLVLFREARQAEGHAGPVGRRSAEEGVAPASAR